MKRRNGFTLIEVLAVIAIMMIVIGIAVGAYLQVTAVAAVKQTHAELHICRGMFTEYEMHNGDTFLTPIYGVTPVLATDCTANVPTVGIVSDMSEVGSLVPLTSPSMPRYASNAVKHTRTALATILQMPQNVTVVEAIQSRRILEPPLGTSIATITSGAVLLDGWRNPIILVPPAGLQVKIKDPNDPAGVATIPYIVRSSGMWPVATAPLVSPSDRPFFASAGEDGDFTVGEDNIYSFQN